MPRCPRDQIGELGGITRLGNRGQRIFGDVLFDLGVFLELLGNCADHGTHRGGIAGCLFQRAHAGLEIAVIGQEVFDDDAATPLDQHLDRSIGQLEQLQHIGQDAGAIDPVTVRVVDGRVDLAGEQYLLVVLHHLFKCAHRFLAADEKRHDHMREHDDVAQRQNGERILGHLAIAFLGLGNGAGSVWAAARDRSGKDLNLVHRAAGFNHHPPCVIANAAPVSAPAQGRFGVNCTLQPQNAVHESKKAGRRRFSPCPFDQAATLV